MFFHDIYSGSYKKNTPNYSFDNLKNDKDFLHLLPSYINKIISVLIVTVNNLSSKMVQIINISPALLLLCTFFRSYKVTAIPTQSMDIFSQDEVIEHLQAGDRIKRSTMGIPEIAPVCLEGSKRDARSGSCHKLVGGRYGR